MTKTRLTIDRTVVDQWIKDAPRMASLWSSVRQQQLPRLLLVLEEWTCPTWSRVSWEHDRQDPGPTAVGLVMTSYDTTPRWHFLRMPQDKSHLSFMIGNTPVYKLVYKR